jgi:predicted nucleic acid-binding protein
MTRYVVLDTGPLGMLARRHPHPAMLSWTRDLQAAGARLVIPEIADYELRRELLQANLSASIQVLDGLASAFDYLPLTTDVMRLAATLWADVRRQGLPTADIHALDGDVILAAQSRARGVGGHDVTVATTNLGHLARLVPAQLWDTIRE